MDARQTSIVTLSVLCVVCVLMAVFGFAWLTRDLPTDSIVGDAKPACIDKVIKSGTKVRPGDVTVSVFNASGRDALAGRTMEKLILRGFGAGDSGNADAKVKRVEVRAADKADPAARLVASQFGSATPVVTGKKPLGIGIVVVIGDDYTKLSKRAKKAVTATKDSTVCSPPVD